jgi:hypothetical protein
MARVIMIAPCDVVSIYLVRSRSFFFFPFFLYYLVKLLMDQSFKNENKVIVNETCGVFINDVIMEKTCDKNLIVQTKIS